jgi:hypothetical protein
MIITASDLPAGNWTCTQNEGESAYWPNTSDGIDRIFYNNPYTEKIWISLVHFNSSDAAIEMRNAWLNRDRGSVPFKVYGENGTVTTYYWNATSKPIKIGDGGGLIQVHNYPTDVLSGFPGQYNDTMLCFSKSSFYVFIYVYWSDHNLINGTEVLQIAQNQADKLSG